MFALARHGAVVRKFDDAAEGLGQRLGQTALIGQPFQARAPFDQAALLNHVEFVVELAFALLVLFHRALL